MTDIFSLFCAILVICEFSHSLPKVLVSRGKEQRPWIQKNNSMEDADHQSRHQHGNRISGRTTYQRRHCAVPNPESAAFRPSRMVLLRSLAHFICAHGDLFLFGIYFGKQVQKTGINSICRSALDEPFLAIAFFPAAVVLWVCCLDFLPVVCD